MRVYEIFKSIQGETSYAGTPFMFVRTTGCNLRCRWCDTTYAYDEGEDYSRDEIKFIAADYNDYVWAKSVIESYKLTDICTVLIAPVFRSLEPKQLAEWII